MRQHKLGLSCNIGWIQKSDRPAVLRRSWRLLSRSPTLERTKAPVKTDVGELSLSKYLLRDLERQIKYLHPLRVSGRDDMHPGGCRGTRQIGRVVECFGSLAGVYNERK